MTDFCFICDKPLAEGASVNVVRGLQTLKAASIERNDGHIEYLNTLTSVNVHTECRKVYTSKHSIAASKRRLEEGEVSTPSIAYHKKRNEVFDFKNLCLFCGQAADKVAERKKKEKYRRTISKVSTIEFKDNVIKKAEERNDTYGEIVKDRIRYEYDLIAVHAKYHTNCYANFSKQVSYGDKKARLDDQITQSMKEIFSYIENSEDSQFTLKEIRDVITEYVPDDKTIITKLQQKYLTDIIIKKKVGSFTIISLRDTQANILSKTWYENKTTTPEEKRLRIVEAAAAIIREDIQSSIVETNSYPPPNKMLYDINKEIPKTLLHFLQEVIIKNRKKSTEHLETKCTAISHAIMASIREQSFSKK